MSNESSRLAQARKHLHVVEADFLTDTSDYHIDEGFGLLEAIAHEGGAEAAIARNLGVAYFSRLRRLLVDALSQATVTEPALKSLLRVSQALERSEFASESDLASLRKTAARRLLDKYFEGYSGEEKERKLQQLLERLEQEQREG